MILLLPRLLRLPVSLRTRSLGLLLFEVQFTDQSTGAIPLSYIWDFNNDGSVDSTLQNPKITLTNEGTYDVNLTVTNAVGSHRANLKTNYITVTAAPVAPTAALFLTFSLAMSYRQIFQSIDGNWLLTYAWDFDNNGINGTTLPRARPTRLLLEVLYTVCRNLTVSNNVAVTLKSRSVLFQLILGTCCGYPL